MSASLVGSEMCIRDSSLRTLRYRHVCQPMVERIRRGTEEAHSAVRPRAEALVQAESAGKYAHLWNL
eukprot:14377958-Alexandrium_andersonii.AAC.1